MKIYIKIILITLLMFTSFFCVDRISIAFIHNNNLYQKINMEAQNYRETPVNAEINESYITPGLNGKSINTLESYYKMRSFNTFNSYYLVFDTIKPEISIEDNKDKIIEKGNNEKQMVSFIVSDENTKNYLINNNIPFDYLIKYEQFNPEAKYEQINNDTINFRKLNRKFNKYNLNSKICYLNDNIKTFCLKEKMYLVNSKLELNNSNIIEVKKSITNGSIIYINDGTKQENIDLIIKEIKFKGLSIVYLSKLISEQKD